MIRILYVDDNDHAGNQLKEILNKIGNFEIKGFQNGRELIDHFKELHQKNIQADIIFIDCFMPIIHGFDTLKEIIKINPDAKVVMMTGVHRKNVIDGIKLGAKWFIWKPFNELNIKSAIQKLI
jgi:two-component system, chemotaxis family, chemotaxis protein CheY